PSPEFPVPRLTRFTCSKCDRRYEVPPALAGLPLLCKGCGTQLTVPDPPDEPEPEPPPPPRPKPKVEQPVAQPPKAAAPPKSAPPPAEEDATPSLTPDPEGGEVPVKVAAAAGHSEANGPPAGPTPPGPNRAAVAPRAVATKPPAARPAEPVPARAA